MRTGVERPELVVDLGSGTGLSTRFWAEHADTVVGVEPFAEMRAIAVAATDAPNVSFLAASSYDTGLSDACADIVTCSPVAAVDGARARFCRGRAHPAPGRVFAAYEYRWSSTDEPGSERRLRERPTQRKAQLRDELGLDTDKTRWPVTRDRFVDSGHFVAVEETVLHSVEQVDADRLVGFALSEGSMTTLLAAGVTEEQVGLDRLREAAAAGLGDDASPWYLGYRLVVGWR